MYAPDDFDVVDVVRATARRRGISPAQVAMAWLARPGVTAPLIGATKTSHIDEAVASLETTLDQAEIDYLQAPYRPHRVLGVMPRDLVNPSLEPLWTCRLVLAMRDIAWDFGEFDDLSEGGLEALVELTRTCTHVIHHRV